MLPTTPYSTPQAALVLIAVTCLLTTGIEVGSSELSGSQAKTFLHAMFTTHIVFLPPVYHFAFGG